MSKTPNNYFAENTLGQIHGGEPSGATSVAELKQEHLDQVRAKYEGSQANVGDNVKMLAKTVGNGEKTRKLLPEHASKIRKAAKIVLVAATAAALAPTVADKVGDDQMFNPERNNGPAPELISQNQAHEEQMKARDEQAQHIEVHEASPGNVNVHVNQDK